MSDPAKNETGGQNSASPLCYAVPTWAVVRFPTYHQKRSMVGRCFWVCVTPHSFVGPVRFLRYTKQGDAVVEHNARLPVHSQFANQKRGSVYQSTVKHYRLCESLDSSA